MPFLKKNKYTLFGITAILLWSSVVALIRDISELFSPIGGAAMIYTISAIFLILVMGIPKIKDFSARYLIIGTILFVAYEMCFALSLGMANNRYQAMEIAIINYLWPALTILFTAILGKRKVNLFIFPSVLITFIGVAWCISGENGLSIRVLMDNITKNPIAYLMAFSGAFIWAVYCFITKQLSNGKNGMTLFFTATAIALWIKFLFSHEINPTFTLSSTITLLLAGIIMGAGYALWNQAIIGGNIMLLGTLSYFTPIFSTLFSSIYLSITLTATFWQGVALVTLGSLICYFITREKIPKNVYSEL